MRLILADKGTIPVPLNGTDALVQLDNRKRTDGVFVTVRAQIQVLGAPAGAVRNGGRISPILSHSMNENGEDTWGPARAWMIRQISESESAAPLAVTPLPASGALPIGVYDVYEQYFIPFASRQLVEPSETAFMERDPQSNLYLRTFITTGRNAITTLVAPAGGSTVQINSLTVNVKQLYADLSGAKLPVYKPRLRENSEPVVGTNPQQLVFLRSQQRLRRTAIGQELTLTADGGTVIVDDIILATRMIGDGGFNVIGPNQSSFEDLVEAQRFNSGGDSTFAGSCLVTNFAPLGRLKDTIFPAYQATNFRHEASVRLSPTGAGTSLIITELEELTRPDANGEWLVVDPVLPEWAASIGG
jgi:hypothetical protein